MPEWRSFQKKGKTLEWLKRSRQEDPTGIPGMVRFVGAGMATGTQARKQLPDLRGETIRTPLHRGNGGQRIHFQGDACMGEGSRSQQGAEIVSHL